MGAPGWNSADRNNHCPVCDGTDNCCISDDGDAAWCGRQSEGSIRTNAGGQHLHILRDGSVRADWWAHPSHAEGRKTAEASAPAKPPVDYSQLVKADTEEAKYQREALAELLGVSCEALEDIGVGYNDIGGNCWTFPERNERGDVIGINRRFETGEKRAIGNRGLTYGPNWDKAGSLLLPEGGSDVAAFATMNLSAIGRPSSTGGAELLAKFIEHHRIGADRRVIVIGENDRLKNGQPRKTHAEHGDKCDCGQCFPGLFGAKSVSQRLTQLLQRPIEYAMPPDDAKDARSWLNSQSDADPSSLGRIFVGGLRGIRRRIMIRTALELVKDFPVMREVLIESKLRRGETANIIAPPKAGKSWLVLGLALCLVSGRSWFDKFACKKCRVLLIDNELHEETLASRVEWVARQMGLDSDEWQGLDIISARGEGFTIDSMAVELANENYDVIICDAWYRFIPQGSDENSNGDITRLYNVLDGIARKIGAAFICIHHMSKGVQGGKAITDLGAGAGAQSRAADTHIAIREHEEDGAYVIDSAVRSFPPNPRIVVRLCHPIWVLADDLDPSLVKQVRTKRKAAGEAGPSREEIQAEKDAGQREKVAKAFAFYPDGETETKLREKAGMSGTTFGPILIDLIKNRVVEPCSIQKGKVSYPGYRLVLTRHPDNQDNQDNRDKSGVLSDLSERSGVTRTTALSLESGVLSDLPPRPGQSSEQSAGGQPA